MEEVKTKTANTEQSQKTPEVQKTSKAPEAPVTQSTEIKKEAKEGSKGLLIFFLLLSLVGLFLLAKYVVPKMIVYLTKATKSTKYSLINSYIFGSPLVVPADGQTKVRISVFLLNNQGMGVASKAISLSSSPKSTGVGGNVQISEIQSMTDNFGKAVFEASSQFVGQFVVTAMVDGAAFPQTVTLTFR